MRKITVEGARRFVLGAPVIEERVVNIEEDHCPSSMR